ncbi:MAG: hypothetical protein KF752_04575 [Pirellulaceae bacterium]|nr:hypothetical protein [Pirellulaceae bacterium]
MGPAVRFISSFCWQGWWFLAAHVALFELAPAHADSPLLQILRANPDPYGYPRPFPNAEHVPVRTSFFIQLGFVEPTEDWLLEESLEVILADPQGDRIALVAPGLRFAPGYSGSLQPVRAGSPAWALNIDSEAMTSNGFDSAVKLRPATRYRLTVSARTNSGSELQAAGQSWYFTTEAQPGAVHSLNFRLDLSQFGVCWQGGFFRGFCKPSFATSGSNMVPTYELMAEVRRNSPNAWIWQRDFWLTGMEHQPQFISPRLPNLVRERETRRVVRIEEAESGKLVHLEDFFGHQQYGIPPDRPLSGDYSTGEEVLIADGVHHARGIVQEIVRDDLQARILRVIGLKEPQGGWKLGYAAPLPEEELSFAPGLFPHGGCYLIKYRPVGTPCYYWGRVDQEWDLVYGRYGHRLIVNFADAPGDLSVDGQNWTYPKDYAQHHQVVHAITTRLIERYGDACLDFLWSVFNEPDLARVFWRSGDWEELQKFYDYTVDAVLRAFEDRGYDSTLVQVGGLEIGAIFGVHIEQPVLERFLAHCSPSAQREGALQYNAALQDSRLEGKRSQRVTELCRATGRGSPCDFISVHAYNSSATMAAKLIRAKELALEIDQDFFSGLAVHSLESCPGWNPPPDRAAADSYLGNGYFSTWCADVARRLLRKATEDQRFDRGDSILTFWPWPNRNFGGHNAATRVIAIDQTGNGQVDQEQTIAMPILHFLGLLARMESPFWVLDEQLVAGHVVSGFASRSGNAIRLLTYAHQAADTQSRSDDRFQVRLELAGLTSSSVRVRQYQFSKQHNSYFDAALTLRDRPDVHQESQLAEIEKAARLLGDRGTVYRPEEIADIVERSQLKMTHEDNLVIGSEHTLTLQLSVLANGANYCEIEPLSD